MSSVQLAEVLLEGFNTFLMDHGPRLRPVEHSAVNKRVEEIVEQVRKQAYAEGMRDGSAWALPYLKETFATIVKTVERNAERVGPRERAQTPPVDPKGGT